MRFISIFISKFHFRNTNLMLLFKDTKEFTLKIQIQPKFFHAILF